MNRTPPTSGPAAVGILGTVLVSALVILAASPAAAGGWWTYPELDTEPLSPGDEGTASATVMFPSTAEAESAGRQYFAYLVRGIDQRALQEAMSQPDAEGWWNTPDDTVLLGELQFGEADTNVRRATVTFVVPEIETGAYSLMFCTRGCTEPLADVLPLDGVYVGDPAAVRLIRDSRDTDRQILGAVGDMEAALQQIQQDVGGVENQVDDLTTRAAATASSVDQVELSTSTLRHQVDELQAATAPSARWLPLLGWFVAGLALAAAWGDRTAATDRRADGGVDDGEDHGARTVSEDVPAPEFVTSF